MTNQQEERMISALEKIALEIETISTLVRVQVALGIICVIILAVTRI